MTKTSSPSRTDSDRKRNNITFQRKENRILDPNQQIFFPNKEQAPRAKRSRTYTLILGFKQKPGSQSRTALDRIPQTIFSETKPAPGDERSRTAEQTKIFRSKQNRLPEPNGTQTSQNKRTKLKWNTYTNNSNKRRQRKNENYALGTRGTIC